VSQQTYISDKLVTTILNVDKLYPLEMTAIADHWQFFHVRLTQAAEFEIFDLSHIRHCDLV